MPGGALFEQADALDEAVGRSRTLGAAVEAGGEDRAVAFEDVLVGAVEGS